MANESRHRLTMVGAGGIGSIAMLLLAKLPLWHTRVWDDDTIGPENVINQMWFHADVGTNKAEAAVAWLRTCGVSATAVPLRYAGEPCFDDIVIAAVDSLESRRLLWKGALAGGKRDALFLDGRLSRETPDFMQLFAIQLDNAEHRECYEEWLSGEGNVDTKRRDFDMVPTPFVLSGIMGTVLVQWLRGKRDLPWQVTYYGSSMLLESNI